MKKERIVNVFLLGAGLTIVIVPFAFAMADLYNLPGRELRSRVLAWAMFAWAPAAGVIGTLLKYVLMAAIMPGIAAVEIVWKEILKNETLLPPKPAVYPLVLFFAWLFWFGVFPRFLRLAGVWNPFRPGRVKAMRPHLAIWWTMIGEWFEMVGKFGRGPTGGWAGMIEVLSHGYREGDVFLGRPKLPLHLGGLLRPIGIETEKHFITISETGAGKSTAGLIPNLCIHRGSLLCVDPKGELATITAPRRKDMGQEVHVVDPFGIVKGFPSSGYNPFDEMARIAGDDEERAVSYAGKIAEGLVTKLSERDKYWDAASETLLRGLILYVYAAEPKERHNLVRVRELLVEGDIDGQEQGIEEGIIPVENGKPKITPFEVLLDQMKLCRGTPCGDAISAAARSLERMGANQMGSVLTNAQEHTAFLDTPEMRRVCRTSSFLLNDLKHKKMSVFLCLPLNAVTGKERGWLRLFVLLFIDSMMRELCAPKPPILLAIDEFPSLGNLEGIEVIAPVMRSYGVRFWAVAQDIGQLEKVYPESWESFLGGAEAVQFMGIKHQKTVEYITRLLSEHVVIEQQEGFQPGTTRPVAVKYPVLDANQVSRILAKGRNNQIIWRGSHRPMLLKICPYYSYLPHWYYSPDPRFPEKWNRAFWRAFSQRKKITQKIEPVDAGPFVRPNERHI